MIHFLLKLTDTKIKSHDECVCKSFEQEAIEDLFHAIVICPKFSDFQEKTLAFMINFDRAEFPTKMNKLNIEEIKQTSNSMQIVEDTRIK